MEMKRLVYSEIDSPTNNRNTSDDNNNNNNNNNGGGDIIMTEYLVLDFTSVVGVDATAARSCFLMLVQLMKVSSTTPPLSTNKTSTGLRSIGSVR